MRYVFPANAKKKLVLSKTMVQLELLVTSKAHFAVSLQINHWLAKWRISFGMPGQYMMSLVQVCLVQATGP